MKENLVEKLKQIEEIEVTPDCEKVLPTKICRKFSRKVKALANGVKKKSNDSFNNYFCSVFSLKLLLLSALVKAKHRGHFLIFCFSRFWLNASRVPQSLESCAAIRSEPLVTRMRVIIPCQSFENRSNDDDEDDDEKERKVKILRKKISHRKKKN